MALYGEVKEAHCVSHVAKVGLYGRFRHIELVGEVIDADGLLGGNQPAQDGIASAFIRRG